MKLSCKASDACIGFRTDLKRCGHVSIVIGELHQRHGNRKLKNIDIGYSAFHIVLVLDIVGGVSECVFHTFRKIRVFCAFRKDHLCATELNAYLGKILLYGKHLKKNAVDLFIRRIGSP